MQAETTCLKITKYIHIRDVFRTQFNIYDRGFFLQKQTINYSQRKVPS